MNMPSNRAGSAEAHSRAGWLYPSAQAVREQIHSLLRAWGMSERQASVSADVMTDTDLSGVDSHGISMLMDYDRSRRSGKLNLKAEPRVLRDRGLGALIDADAGLGHAAAVMGMELAIERARVHGAGIVCVRNSHHFGAAGHYVRMAAAAGLIGLCTSSTRTINTVPTRGRLPLLGTNPIAFAAPAASHPPFVLDMATSSVASNKVKVYELQGKSLPAGWVCDANGQPVIDAAQAMEILFRQSKEVGGGLAPLGGTPEMSSHKGYGLAVMVHILGGCLSGASFSPIRVRSQRPQDPDNLGHFFLAIDPTMFREPGEFEADMDALIATLHAAPPADPAAPVLVPGEPEERARRERAAQGIPVPPSLARQIRSLCAEADVAFLLD
jgi:LDH2 family malate/lactate/ureidoglycolate dehydrogenase